MAVCLQGSGKESGKCSYDQRQGQCPGLYCTVQGLGSGKPLYGNGYRKDLSGKYLDAWRVPASKENWRISVIPTLFCEGLSFYIVLRLKRAAAMQRRAAVKQEENVCFTAALLMNGLL